MRSGCPKIAKIGAVLLFSAFLVSDLRSQDQPTKTDYSSGFFEQLAALFGRFRNADLQNAFQEAHPIGCSEVTWGKGEWRPVAFFNEDRKLGYWCRLSLDEVKADLTVFTFKGSCDKGNGSVKVATRFPTAAGVNSYRQGKIGLDQIDLIENDPVKVRMNSKTKACVFELPYLFLKNEGTERLFSFNPPDRKSAYDLNVSSLWECKSVLSKDVTYYFMICRVSTVQRNKGLRSAGEPEVEDRAFFILSDGVEARTSMKMTLDENADKNAGH